MLPPEKLLEVIKLQTEVAQLGLDLGGVMQVVVERTLSLLDIDGAAIELAEDDDMVYRACSGIAASHLGLRLGKHGSLSGLSVKTGEILCCNDTENDPRVDKAACDEVGLRSMLVVPLCYKDSVVGVLKAMSVRPNRFTGADLDLLGLLSRQVAASMYFATRYNIDELFYKATHDELTGLTNRSLFMDRLRGLMAQCARQSKTMAVLMIDMNGLKRINDAFGHRIGDVVIKEFADRVRAVARSSDTVSRLGGDEFGMILSPVESIASIDAVIQRIQARIDAPFCYENQVYPFSASIGSAHFPEDSDEINRLIEIADLRMYQVKQNHYRNALV